MREARIDAGKSPARQAFIPYLRTGEWLPEAAFAPPPVETKFNPYHDPHDGRFTFAPGEEPCGRPPRRRDAIFRWATSIP